MTDGVGRKIPENCRYWRFQGDHNMIGCQITGALCHEDCDPDRVDPTGNLRRKIDDERNKRKGKWPDNT